MSRPDFKMRVRLEAAVAPSEDAAKVMQALRNVIGGNQGEEAAREGSVSLTTEDIKAFLHIRDQLRDRHVRSAARRQLLLNSTGRSTSLMLNKQAAAAGVVALCGSPEESPLGPIYVTLESDGLEPAIDWMAAYEAG